MQIRGKFENLPIYIKRSGNPDHSTYLYSRKPDGSLPLTGGGSYLVTRVEDLSFFHKGESDQGHLMPEEGEVTIRYTVSEQNKMVIILSLVNKDQHSDIRWKGRPDYFMVELPTNKRKEFIDQSLHDPTFVHDVLRKLASNPNFLDNYNAPTHVVCATKPGLFPISLDKRKIITLDESSNIHRITRDAYKGNYLISDGQNITVISRQEEGEKVSTKEKDPSIELTAAIDQIKFG